VTGSAAKETACFFPKWFQRQAARSFSLAKQTRFVPFFRTFFCMPPEIRTKKVASAVYL
jgi:hypothetical protein